MKKRKILISAFALLLTVGIISCAKEGGNGSQSETGASDSLTEVDSLVEGLELLQRHM